MIYWIKRQKGKSTDRPEKGAKKADSAEGLKELRIETVWPNEV